MEKNKIMISGHRGTRVHAIENTPAAFDYCLRNGFDYIEFDVQATRDGRLVVFHDETIDALLDGTGRLANHSLEELRRLRYRDGQTVQTLEEFFEQVGRHARPMLEIKARGICRQVMDSVHSHGYRGDQILIQSFDPGDILECWRLDPQYDYGLCMGQLGEFKVKSPPVQWLNLDGPFIFDEFIDAAAARGIRIILGAQETERYLSKLERWKVEIVNCDDGVRIRSLIEAAGLDAPSP